MQVLSDWYLRKPWWTPFATAVAAFTALAIVPTAAFGRSVAFWLTAAYTIAFLITLAGCAALVRRFERRHLLSQGRHLPDIRRMSWEQLEDLTSEVYQHEGYTVVELGQRGPDAGVDLVLEKNGARTYVQCKQHQGWLDVRWVREFYGVMASEKTKRGVIVCTGGFSPAAQEFAKRVDIQLVGGQELESKVRDVLMASGELGAMTPKTSGRAVGIAIPLCPKCRSDTTWHASPQGWACRRSSCSGFVAGRIT